MADLQTLEAAARVAVEIVLNGLWQGTVAALVAWLLARALGRSSAATRYVLLGAALVSILVLPAASALSRLASRGHAASPSAANGAPAAGTAVDESSAVPGLQSDFEVAAIEPAPAPRAPIVEVRGGWWTPLVFALLLAVCGVRLARVGAGAIAIARMRRRCRPLGSERVAMLTGWSRYASRGRSARLCSSPDARVPMVLGPWRPIVAIPEALLDRLSDSELDHIALHELAHVRRRDDWAKLLQSVVEALCSFHPAAWWVARRVDAEREVACDDWVLSVTRARRPYAMCLLKLAGLGPVRNAVPAPGAFGRKPMLSERIELVMKTNRNAHPRPSMLSRWSVATALVVATLCCMAAGPAVTLSALPLADITLGESPRGATSHSGPEPATVASRGATSDLDTMLREESRSLIAQDDLRGEDPEVRRAAIEALGDHAGTVVVLDPSTGVVFALVNQEWGVRRGFSPASTIKLVTALAALDAKTFDPTDRVAAQGKRVNLDQAVAYSNTDYFQRIGERAGVDRFLAAARALGLGEATGANYPNEYAGSLPNMADPEILARTFGAGVGFEVTPVQLAALVSAIANGGTLVSPHVPREGEVGPAKYHPIAISPESIRRLLPGMKGAVKFGTGVPAADKEFAIAGKTGSTADGPEGATGLFVSFAPADKPSLAIVVVTRGHDEVGWRAAQVAGRIYKALRGRVLC